MWEWLCVLWCLMLYLRVDDSTGLEKSRFAWVVIVREAENKDQVCTTFFWTQDDDSSSKWTHQFEESNTLSAPVVDIPCCHVRDAHLWVSTSLPKTLPHSQYFLSLLILEDSRVIKGAGFQNLRVSCALYLASYLEASVLCTFLARLRGCVRRDMCGLRMEMTITPTLW